MSIDFTSRHQQNEDRRALELTRIQLEALRTATKDKSDGCSSVAAGALEDVVNGLTDLLSDLKHVREIMEPTGDEYAEERSMSRHRSGVSAGAS